jgi:hypothetical protein
MADHIYDAVYFATRDRVEIPDFDALADVDGGTVEFAYIDAYDESEDSEREAMPEPWTVEWQVFEAVADDLRDIAHTALADMASESRAWGGSSDWD